MKVNQSAAVCAIELKDGSMCGIQAIGRCANCGRAFCLTHQAREWYNPGPVPYVDMCAPCLAKTPAKVAEAEAAKRQAEAAKRQAEVSAAEQYFKSGSARTALLNSGVLPVEIYRTFPKWKTGLFGLGGRYVDEVTFIWRGWILGQFEWKYVNGGPRERTVIVADYFTALLNVSPDDPVETVRSIQTKGRTYYLENMSPEEKSHLMFTHALIRVQPYSGGFGGSSSGYRWVYHNGDRFQSDWIAAEQAVKRLTGESN